MAVPGTGVTARSGGARPVRRLAGDRWQGKEGRSLPEPILDVGRATNSRRGRLLTPAVPYDSPMLYRLTRAINEYYGVVVLGFFVLAFFIALAFTVIFPIVPFVLLFLCLFLVVFFSMVSKVLRAIERLIARRSLRKGRCPACQGELIDVAGDGELMHECVPCGWLLRANGEEWQRDPDGPERPVSAVGPR